MPTPANVPLEVVGLGLLNALDQKIARLYCYYLCHSASYLLNALMDSEGGKLGSWVSKCDYNETWPIFVGCLRVIVRVRVVSHLSFLFLGVIVCHVV